MSEDQRPAAEGPGIPEDLVALLKLEIEKARALMEIPGAAAALLSDEGENEERRTNLFGVVLDLARMDAEDGGCHGEAFLAEAREEVVELSSAGGLDLKKGRELLQAYTDAGLEAPGELLSLVLEGTALGIRDGSLVEQFRAELEDLRLQTESDDYELYVALWETMEGIPVRLRPLIMQDVAGESDPWSSRAALYCLLDEPEEARMTAAEILATRARLGTLDPAAASALPLVRSWLPADDVAPVVDEALREARRRGVAGAPERPALPVARLVGTLPDGSGSQRFVAGLEGADGPVATMLLLEPGFGVRDAFPMRGEEAAGAPSLLLAEAGSFVLEPGALEPALAAALADGLAAGVLPAPGLLDVFEACGLEALRPRPMTARDWLERLDPAGEIAALDRGERKRLIGRSVDRILEHGFGGYLFESPRFVDGALDALDDEDPVTPALWAALEERRGHWALVLARAAHVLKSAAREQDWRPFAAAAAALIEGEALEEIPILNLVLGNSIAVWRDDGPAPHGDGPGPGA